MKKQIILLEVPEVILEDTPDTYDVGGFICPECNGTGEVWRQDCDDSDGWPDGWVKKPCPVCGGSGKIMAEVTVNWKKQED